MNSDVYVFCQLFYPELISSGQTVTELCESLTKNGKKITVYCAQPSIVNSDKIKQEIIYKTIVIKRLASTRFSKLNFLGKLINHISFSFSCILRLFSLPNNASVIIFTNPPILPLVARFVQLFKSFNYHLILFDLYPQTLIAANILKPDSLIAKLYQHFIASTYVHAKTLVSIGRCMKTIVDNSLQSTHNSIYIPIWADTAHIQKHKSKIDFKQHWGLENKFIVGYSGNIAKFHPIETMIYAAEKLQSTSDIVFLFVGEGAKKYWAESYCKTHNISNCIFKSYVDRDDLPNLLHIFDCGLVGLLNENTGFSVPSKAMGLLSAGIPILACVKPECEINLILQSFNCGLQSSPDDRDLLAQNILSLYKNEKERKVMSENALLAVKTRFNLTHITQDYLQILSKS